MKQTAVEWLAERLESITQELFLEAKEMEKQQIIDAYQNGDNNGFDRIYYNSDRDDKSAEEYYNETFNK